MCTFRGQLQKVHTIDTLNGERETKSNNPKMHVSYVHVTILQNGVGIFYLQLCLVYFQLVFAASGALAWSCLVAVEIRFALFGLRRKVR